MPAAGFNLDYLGGSTMFKPRTFEIPLYGGDYQQRVARSEAKVAQAEDDAKNGRALPRMMDETETEVDRLVREHNELVAEAEAEGCTRVTLKAIGRKRWNALVDAHPPRTDEDVPQSKRDGDAEIGVNDDAFGEALLLYVDPDDDEMRTIYAVSDETPVAELLDLISSYQFDLLYRSAFALNRDGGSAPKALTPSLSIVETAS